MEWLFLVVSFVAVVAAGLMLTRQNAVHSALFLIVNFGCVAFLYLMLDAPFLAMVQVTVYTGAIMVLFLFVIMLLGAEATTDTSGRMRWLGFVSTAVAILILLIFGFPIASDMLDDDVVEQPDAKASLRIINAVSSGDGSESGVIEPGADYSASAMDRTLLEGAVHINVALDSLDDAQSDIAFDPVDHFGAGDATPGYSELPAGSYALRASLSAMAGDMEFSTTPILSRDLQLAADDALTLLAFEGSDNLINMALLADDLSAPSVGLMRLTLINTVADAQVSLVDIGQYTAIRTLCENDSCDALIPHRVLAADLPSGESLSVELDEGKYNLAFVDGGQNVLRALVDYQAERGKVETRLLVRDPGIPGGQASYRAVMFDALGKPAFGSPESIGQVLFIDYVLPVQLVGILLLVALIGVIVLARPDALRQAERRRVNQRRRVSRPLVSVLSQQTGSDVLSGDYLAKLPGGSDDPAQN
ncbi:MAG: NADH-quinone oxidoreductase subunit J [Chloroflexota bacterium]|nr:NADH-quinone oxidoreductase subunit J [Chloroflexota bacterium]